MEQPEQPKTSAVNVCEVEEQGQVMLTLVPLPIKLPSRFHTIGFPEQLGSTITEYVMVEPSQGLLVPVITQSCDQARPGQKSTRHSNILCRFFILLGKSE